MKTLILSLAAVAALSTGALAGSYDGDSRPFDIRDISKQAVTEQKAFTAVRVVRVKPMQNRDARNDKAGMSN